MFVVHQAPLSKSSRYVMAGRRPIVDDNGALRGSVRFLGKVAGGIHGGWIAMFSTNDEVKPGDSVSHQSITACQSSKQCSGSGLVWRLPDQQASLRRNIVTSNMDRVCCCRNAMASSTTMALVVIPEGALE